MTGQAPGPPARGRSGRLLAWVAMAAVTLAAWAALTWPLALRMDGIWVQFSRFDPGSNPAARYQPDMLIGGDHLQNAFIQTVVIDNVRHLRNPFLDLYEGAAGPAPLRTSSLDVPWTPLVALLWPLVGLQAAYNATLVLSTLATGLAAFGWLRRHTRWQLLAGAGALAYTFTPHHMSQLVSHFNGVMWWVFPASLWALEAAMERHREGRRWRWPAVAVGALAVLVAASGEYHLSLYLTALLCFLTAFELASAWLARRPLPWAPAATVAGGVALGVAYTLVVFTYVFRGDVQGGNGDYGEVLRFAPGSALWLVRRDLARFGEGMVYVGWAVVALAAVGLVAALAGRGRPRAARPYAVLAVPLLFFTLGPAADLGGFRPYRFLAEHVSVVGLQRVPQRLMVLTSLVLVLLAVCALDLAAGWLLAARPRLAPVAAAALLAGTALLLADYVVGRNVVMDNLAGNRVVAALRAAGDRAGPILGVPVREHVSATSYVAALSRRRALNAYNQTPAPWLNRRMRQLQPISRGRAGPTALEVLRGTGATQVVVLNEPHVYRPGQWRQVVDKLVASGHFRLALTDGPFALLELTGPP
ncbi:MAG TPA: hypothetical protein VFC13_04745 [Actinomycetes bacterium]|nr:hypothetical protein [Actinomycetes bacterium]